MGRTLFGVEPDSLNQEESLRLIGHHAGLVASCFADAWEVHWLGNVAGVTRAKIDSMQRGGVIHNIASDLVNERLEDGPVVKKCGVGFFKVYFQSVQGTVVVRFMKLRSDGSVCLTGRRKPTRRYFNGSYLKNVYPNATRLIAGYILDPLGSQIADVRITRQVGDDVLWQSSILGQAESWRLPVDEPSREAELQRFRLLGGNGSEEALA